MNDDQTGQSTPHKRFRPPTTRDGRPPTTRDARPPTTRDSQPPTTRDDGAAEPVGGEPAAEPSRRDRVIDIMLPDYLAEEYDVDDDLSSGGEADVARIKSRRDGQLKVVKIYRRGITLPQSFVEQLATADPAHVLPVTRSTYDGWKTPRFIEVMDYLPDGSLETLLEQTGDAAGGLAREILVEMTDALEYIHTRLGIVHRDIKPANVLIRSREPLDLVLADLGIATTLAELRLSRRESIGGVKGTLIYQSPETLNLSDAGAPRDWWALGMTMCEVLTGVHPFKDSQGNTLRDENMIRHAITMGAIDLSMLPDERWKLLCHGLLVHDPDHRWAAPQVRAWLAGEAPPVAALKPQSSPERAMRPYRFDGHRFTDPAALASHMVTHWDAAAKVFTSDEECATLRAWIREDVNDVQIDVNSLTPISRKDQSRTDARIIEFTTHYLGADDLVFRGEPITAQSLAARYLQAGEGWAQDPLLAALTPDVVAALADTQRNDAAGPSGQTGEYYALARLSRFAKHLDEVIETARSEIGDAVASRVEGVDVGSPVRDGLPACIARARGLARAALLSEHYANGIHEEFRRIRTQSPPWFAILCTTATVWAPTAPGTSDKDWLAAEEALRQDYDRGFRKPRSRRAGADAPFDIDCDEIALKSLSVAVADLAAIYSRAAADAVATAERQRAEARAEQERRHAVFLEQQREDEIRRRTSARRGRDLRFIIVAGLLCVTVAIPLALGYFVMGKTPLLKPSAAVWTDEVRKFSDHFPAYYLAGVFPILLLLAAALLWPPLERRRYSVAVGGAALIAALFAIGQAQSSWNGAEDKAADRLRETAFPFSKTYLNCASWTFRAENGVHQPELWQVHLGQVQGTAGNGCNRVNVYRGWQFVGAFNLPEGDIFTGHIAVNHVGWDKAYEQQGSGDVWQTSRATGAQTPMNPVATNIDLSTKRGHALEFSLDGAASGAFDLH